MLKIKKTHQTPNQSRNQTKAKEENLKKISIISTQSDDEYEDEFEANESFEEATKINKKIKFKNES